MSQTWINRFVRRYRKRTSNQRHDARRRLLLEGLETRTLLAADAMPMTVLVDDHPAPLAIVAHDDGVQCSAHPDDPAKRGEHCAALALVPHDQVTHAVVASGNWSNPTTWQDGVLPTDGASILVPHGTTLTVDRIIPLEFKTLRVDGTLRFANDSNTEIRADTLVAAPGSVFEMGTTVAPISSNVRARVVVTDTDEIDREADPFGLGAARHEPHSRCREDLLDTRGRRTS